MEAPITADLSQHPIFNYLVDFNKASQQQKQQYDWSNIFNTHESYVIITKPEEVKAISQAILQTLPEPILGVDCEGLTKGRPLSLL